MTFSFLSFLLGVSLGAPAFVAVGYFVGWIRGFRRGKEFQAMEPPVYGIVHFSDGWVSTVYADSAVEALARVVGRAKQDVSARLWR